MKTYITLICFALFFAAACTDNPQKPADAAPQTAEQALAAYAGTYNGILPCADCEGIDTELTLSPEGAFTLIEFYLSDESDLYLTEGTWRLSPDLSHIIFISADAAQNPMNLYYARKGIDLVKLDIHAKPINSDLNYVLRRK